MGTETAPTELFSGTPMAFGGLSNEAQLAQRCPATYKELNNEWHLYALRIHRRECGNVERQWRTDSLEARQRQWRCVYAVMRSLELSGDTRAAIAGWMLSEMFVEVPAFVPKFVRAA